MLALNEVGDRIAADREPIRSHVTRALARLIATGEIGPEEIIGVAAASRLFGVSPTPVREALVELSQQGLVDVQSGRGFTVRPLDAEELRELYETINALEIVALRLEPEVSTGRLTRLDELNRRLRKSESGFEALELDAAWHEELVGGCDNSVVRQQLRALRMRARRYEVRFMADADRVAAFAGQHDAIVAALREGRLEEALAQLQANWLGSIVSAVPELEQDPPRPLRGLLR